MEILITDISKLNKLKKENFNVVYGKDYDVNKRILENKSVKVLLDPEPLEEDFMKYKNSGLNQVLVKLAKRNNIGIGFSLPKLKKLGKLNKSKLLGKILQNIILCNKYKVPYYILYDDENKNDVEALGLSLGCKNIRVIPSPKAL